MYFQSGKLNALVIDDELSGRTMIEYYINEFLSDIIDNIIITSTIDDARKSMLNFTPNIIFTDYELSGEDGLKIVPYIPKESILVVVTAHSQYAINAIRANVFDYILKPIDEYDFIKFKERLMKKLNLNSNKSDSDKIQNSLVIKDNSESILIPFNDILYLEASGAYSKVVTLTRNFIATKTLKTIESSLPETFIRVHRSYIVPKWQITSFGSNYVCLKNGTHISLSKNGKKLLQELF